MSTRRRSPLRSRRADEAAKVLHLGSFRNRPDHIEKLVARLAKGNRTLSFCYEAGPCGYGLFRQIVALGHDCMVAAPLLIPMKAGDRVKTDRRDAVMLAPLHRAGELTAEWVPDDAHEAMRDLIRARATAVRVLSKARQHLQGFLLRHGRVYAGKKGWTQAYRRWLTTVRVPCSELSKFIGAGRSASGTSRSPLRRRPRPGRRGFRGPASRARARTR